MGSGLNKLLEDLADKLPGFVASAVVLADDGLTVAGLSRDADVDADVASAYLATIVKSNLKAVKLLAGEQATDDILITTDTNYYLVRHISGIPCFLFVMSQKNEWLGRARLLMKEYERKVYEELKPRDRRKKDEAEAAAEKGNPS
ncbi:MAG: roadblock/LC7 domain-containing protein [Desulfatibacillaceae bacterium]